MTFVRTSGAKLAFSVILTMSLVSPQAVMSKEGDGRKECGICVLTCRGKVGEPVSLALILPAKSEMRKTWALFIGDGITPLMTGDLKKTKHLLPVKFSYVSEGKYSPSLIVQDGTGTPVEVYECSLEVGVSSIREDIYRVLSFVAGIVSALLIFLAQHLCREFVVRRKEIRKLKAAISGTVYEMLKSLSMSPTEPFPKLPKSLTDPNTEGWSDRLHSRFFRDKIRRIQHIHERKAIERDRKNNAIYEKQLRDILSDLNKIWQL